MDVDDVLSLSVAKFNEWIAMYYRIGLDDAGWAMAGTVAAAVQNAGYNIQCTLASSDPKDKHYRMPSDFIPGDQKNKSSNDSVADFVEKMRGRYG